MPALIGQRTEEERHAFVGEAEEIHEPGPDPLDDGAGRAEENHQPGEGELQGQTHDHDPPVDRTPVAAEQNGDADQHRDAEQAAANVSQGFHGAGAGGTGTVAELANRVGPGENQLNHDHPGTSRPLPRPHA